MGYLVCTKKDQRGRMTLSYKKHLQLDSAGLSKLYTDNKLLIYQSDSLILRKRHTLC